MNRPLDPAAAARSAAPPWLQQRPSEGLGFTVLCRAAAWSSFAFLIVILGSTLFQAQGALDWQFLTSFDSRILAEKAGVLAGLWGTFWVISLTLLLSTPIGVGAALYLEEYALDTWLTRVIRTNLANLAGVPSVVYGMLGLTVFVRMFGLFETHGPVHRWLDQEIVGVNLLGLSVPLPFGPSVISAACTLSLLILPVIIVASQEALRAVPASLRHASLALGATHWQMVSRQVLPAAAPGIATGVILAISRAIGETAPLIVIGAAFFIRFAPGGIDAPGKLLSLEALTKAPFDRYTVVPIQVFNWAENPQKDFQQLASAGIIVLLAMLLVLNGCALWIRQRAQKHTRW